MEARGCAGDEGVGGSFTVRSRQVSALQVRGQQVRSLQVRSFYLCGLI